jgi:hypothetical protein
VIIRQEKTKRGIVEWVEGMDEVSEGAGYHRGDEPGKVP